MKWILIFIILLLLFIFRPKSTYSRCTTCNTNYDIPYMNNVIESGAVGNPFVFSINIPYSTYILSNKIIGTSIINKWDSILKGSIGNALSQIPGYNISPLNIYLNPVQPDANGGLLITFLIDDIAADFDQMTIIQEYAFYLLFKPNLITNVTDINTAVLDSVGCPISGCTANGTILCQPNIGCEDNGILSQSISTFIGGSPLLAIKCYYNQAPSSSTPLLTI